jgi:hypothetical protein
MVGLLVVALGLGSWAKFIWPKLPGNAEKTARIVAIGNWHRDCEADSEATVVNGGPRGCLTRGGGPVRILLWGDSHAGQLKPVLDALADARGDSGLLRYEILCPPAMEFGTGSQDSRVRKCVSFNRDVLADIRALHTLDTVILNAFWVAYARQADQLPQLIASLKRTVEALRAMGVQIVLVAPDMEFPHRVPECLIRRDEPSCELSRSDALEQRAAAMSVINTVALAYPDVVVIDPLDTLCPKNQCPVRNGQDVLYSDRNHLSTAGAKLLIPAFLAAQEKLRAARKTVLESPSH